MGFDAIVIGLGAMGSAALYQLAQRGATILGVDQFDPPHALGSTHGESRVTRLAVGEGEAYIPLVRRTHEIWQELEAKTGTTLLHKSGGYILGPIGGGAAWHREGDFVASSAAIAAVNGIKHELLPASEIRRRHPVVQVEPHFHAYYEPGAGIVIPEAAIRAQLGLAQGLGAVIHTNERVASIQAGADGVAVRTDKGRYEAEKVIVAAGPWINQLLPEVVKPSMTVYRQVMLWYEAENLDLFKVDRFPFLLWIGETKEDYFAAFPVSPGSKQAVKLMTEQYVESCDPDSVSREVTTAEIEAFTDRFVQRKLRRVTSTCVAAKVCLYTVTPDEHFVIDWHPASQRILFASPCSGHGFKHSAAIGESLAELVLDGQSHLDLTPFSIQRFLL